MCRIAGFVSYSFSEIDAIRMRDSMNRGGPDDAGIYYHEKNHLFLLHRRLSIIDLSSAGHQPMSDPEGKIQMVYNGELYNYRELQRELANVEDKLAAARRALNAAVSRYNTGIQQFPAVLFAGMLGFAEADFNKLDDSEKGTVDQVPQVRF